MARSRRTQDEMFPLVESYLESRRTVKDFCSEHELSVAVFTYWLTKYRRQVRPAEPFAEITPMTGSREHPVAEVVYPNGIRLRFYSAVAPSYLATLVGSELVWA